jgi:hypothetical protein
MEQKAIVSHLRLSSILDGQPPVRAVIVPKNEGEVVMLAIGREGSTFNASPPMKSPRN